MDPECPARAPDPAFDRNVQTERSERGAAVDVWRLKEWFRRPPGPREGTTPDRSAESLDVIWGRNREAHDLLRASLEMLIAARQAEVAAETKNRKTETNGAIDGRQ